MTLLKSLLMTTLLALSSAALASPLKVQVHGLQMDQGAIVINLFVSAESWSGEVPDKVVQITSLQGADASTTVDLPPGDYAFFLYHDEDSSGQLKRGAFGLPAEPYAFSNNLHLGLSKPSFEKMKFTVTEQGAVQDIQLVIP